MGLATSFVFTSCRKDDFVDKDNELGGKGATVVKVYEGNEPTAFLEASAGTKLVSLFSVRRDAPSNAVMNQPTTVTLTYDASLITAYNAAHPVSGAPNTYIALPETIFTPGPGVTKTATGYTVNIGAGEFAKDFAINLNFALYDFNKKYALPFKITSDATGTVMTQPTVLSFVSVKNAYDGVYSSVAGTVTRYAGGVVENPSTLNGSMAGNPDVRLVTVNATTVQISGLNWTNSGGGIGGVDPITMTIDPATNAVTQIRSGVATTTMSVIPGAVNKYDPATKTFTLNFDWNQLLPNKREVKGLVLTYKGVR